MSPAIGNRVERNGGADILARARARAANIPDLLVDAHQLANSVFSGWHGRRKRGHGENFWQFRPYVSGENQTMIDWRRSARDDHLYVRDLEWQATHTVWVWADESPSMLFASELASVSKQSRALVLAFAMIELLALGGERVGWINVSPLTFNRNAAERMAGHLALAEPQTQLPATTGMQNLDRYADIILFSDFLEPFEQVAEKIAALAKTGARGHLVQIIDPCEEVFPYSGRVEFEDPESGQKYTAGAAHTLKEDYQALFAAHSQGLQDLATKLGWSFTRHHTDHLASDALISLHTHLGGKIEGGAR